MTSDRTAESSQTPAFADRLMSVLNDGALCLMISTGHRTGLFDAMRDAPPLTSPELAARAGLNERYVREWLGAMTTGRVVLVDPDTLRFTLPSDHAALLTRAAAEPWRSTSASSARSKTTSSPASRMEAVSPTPGIHASTT